MMGNNRPYHSLNGEPRVERRHANHVHEVKITKKLAFLETPVTCAKMAEFQQRHPEAITNQTFRFTVYDDPAKAYALGDSIKHPPKETKVVSIHDYWSDPTNADLPATGLSWDEAVLFCSRASDELAVCMRLPTEAEWEYACRAGTSSVFYFSEDTTTVTAHAWCCANSDLEPKQPKGFKPNPWGLYDIVGNVWEWCQDKYWPEYYPLSPVADPFCDETKVEARAIRGGSSMNKAETCRSSHRYGLAPGRRDRFLGFRPIIELP